MQKVLGQTSFVGTQLPAAKPLSRARNARVSVQATVAAPPRLDTSTSERVRSVLCLLCNAVRLHVQRASLYARDPLHASHACSAD